MVHFKTEEDLQKLRKANKIVAEILQVIKENTKPGMTGVDLDEIARAEAEKRNVKPAFLGLYGFPAALCVSINEEIVHGIPKKNRVIKEGDIVSIDFGVVYDGWYGDAAISYIVGDVKSQVKERLLKGVEKSLEEAIKQCKPGNTTKDIARAIEETLKEYRLSPICDYGGHGIGRKPHDEPHVSNCVANAENVVLKPGMVLAIEPMATLGRKKNHYRKLKDGWTVVSKDKTLSAHFEHSVAITENGAEVLSKLD
ncbi:MAG: type I methionyl aminopeptidase [Aquificae bacterium]|nr:type I methionyl aminopeptidase [Aquificota bacterium]